MICASRRKGAQLVGVQCQQIAAFESNAACESGSISRNTSRLTVDLPQPDSPTSASVLPRSTLKLTPSTALTKCGRASEHRTRGDEMLDQIVDFEQGGHLSAPPKRPSLVSRALRSTHTDALQNRDPISHPGAFSAEMDPGSATRGHCVRRRARGTNESTSITTPASPAAP